MVLLKHPGPFRKNHEEWDKACHAVSDSLKAQKQANLGGAVIFGFKKGTTNKAFPGPSVVAKLDRKFIVDVAKRPELLQSSSDEICPGSVAKIALPADLITALGDFVGGPGRATIICPGLGTINTNSNSFSFKFDAKASVPAKLLAAEDDDSEED